MTNYQKLMDTISQELFKSWQDGANGYQWNEENAREMSHRILTYVEMYQSHNVKLKPNIFN